MQSRSSRFTLRRIGRAIQFRIFRIPSILKKVARKVLPVSVQETLRKRIVWFERRWVAQVLKGDEQALAEVLEQHRDDPRPIIVFPPSLDWNTQLFQRPQQLALSLARQGALVFYCQPKPDRSKPQLEQIRDGLYLCNVLAQTFEIIEQPNVVVLTWNCGYMKYFNSPHVVYDYVDDINVFYADHDEVVRNHERMKCEAQTILVTAHKLYDEIAPVRADAVYCPNGVDYDHFAIARQTDGGSVPQDLREIIGEKKPVIGYYGALARWFDYALLKQIALARPQYNYLLIGPDYDGSLEPAGLTSLPNLHWLGVKSYWELPNYLRAFDVAMIPFILNDITHATSPLKLFEYMAGGKPVVVTPMRESTSYEGVLVASGADEFASKLDEALRLAKDPAYQALLDRVARENTWDARAKQIIDVLSQSCKVKSGIVESVA
ncbi:MAG TPA: glycosyltransferase [Anaerolineaceae bacterium]|nr:glycosyltransferase [Anaerolineaceae bacterium]